MEVKVEKKMNTKEKKSKVSSQKRTRKNIDPATPSAAQATKWCISGCWLTLALSVL
jgi:hypothetical protein